VRDRRTPLPVHDAMNFLEITSLSKQYGQGEGAVHALRGVSFGVSRGEFVALSGPSGCGKSSLLSIGGLVMSPSSGRVVIAGEAINFENERNLARYRRTLLGYVFQYFNLLPTLTAEENVIVTPLLAGVSSRDARRRARELLEQVGLVHRCTHRPHQLSGGEMQRVAVCRALAHHPRLILADEPTGNLDTKSGHAVLDLLKKAASEGAAVIMATHREDSLTWCGRVIRLHDGELVGDESIRFSDGHTDD
jgi:putative ABC transport system ATP-binding protein